jgi:hypothetical protein
MLIEALLLAHIAVLGYWLGSDLVINSTFRFVSRASSMPFVERARLLDHVMDVDQHVRYALVLQVGLGTALAALLGYLPGGAALAWAAGAVAVAWLILVEVTHRWRRRPVGTPLGRIDRATRYVAVAAAVVLAIGGLTGSFSLTGWLAWKLALLAGAIVSGLGIRFELTRYFRVWHEIGAEGSTAMRESLLRRRYTSATAVLVVLWLFIASIVALSLLKP